MKIYEILNDKEKFNFACIYLWTNLLNGKVYVGQTQNFYNRMKQYYKKREHRLINFALDKYGFDNFDVTIETKRKISEGNKGKMVSEETRDKISRANKGKTSKKVRCIELDRVFDSILSAAEFIGKDHKGISSCLHGKQKTSGGYHWEFVEK